MLRMAGLTAAALALSLALSGCTSDEDLWPPEEGPFDDAGADGASSVDGTVVVDGNVADRGAPDSRADAADVFAPDASDASAPDTAPPLDASDASDANDATSADASDATTLDASDAATLDAAADASDAGAPIACGAVPGVLGVYYGRYDTSDAGVTALPDGGSSAYGTLWVASGDGTSDQYLGQGYRPRLAPDRHHLAYESGGGAQTTGSIYVKDLWSDAGADTLVFGANADHVVGYAWTSDNAGLVYDYLDAFWAVARDGTGGHSLFTYVDGFSDGPAISLMDDRIAFHNAGFGLGIANGDGSQPATIANSVAGDLLPAWSPDGAWLAFVHTGGDVYKMHPDGTGRARLTASLQPGEGFVPGGAVTGDSAAWVGVGTLRGVPGIYVVPLDGSGAYRRICTSPGAPLDVVGSVTAP